MSFKIFPCEYFQTLDLFLYKEPFFLLFLQVLLSLILYIHLEYSTTALFPHQKTSIFIFGYGYVPSRLQDHIAQSQEADMPMR